MGEKWTAVRSVDEENAYLDTWEVLKSGETFASGMMEQDAQRLALLLNAIWQWSD